MIKRKENSQVVSLFEYSTMTESEKEFERVRLASDIEIDKAFKEYAMVSGLEGIEAVYTESESNGKSDSAFVKVIDAIITKVKQIFKAFMNLVENLFKTDMDSDKEKEKIFSSSTSQIRFNSDVQKIRRACEEEIEEGSKLIQLISTTTGANPSKVRKFCDKAGNFARYAVPTVMGAGLAWGIKKSVEMTRGYDDTCRKIESACERCKNIQDKEKRAQATQVLKSMQRSYSECLQHETSFIKKLKTSFEAEKKLYEINRSLNRAEDRTDLFTTKAEKRARKKAEKEQEAFERKRKESEQKKEQSRKNNEAASQKAEDVIKDITGTK